VRAAERAVSSASALALLTTAASLAVGCLLAGCQASSSSPTGSAPAVAPAPSPSLATSDATTQTQRPPASTDAGGSLALGGRLFDKWFAPDAFRPDDKATVGVADGHGGPFGNGTLANASGVALLNDKGHDYRLKNLFGWDLRGDKGIYGPQALGKPFVSKHDLLADTRSADELAAWLARGDTDLPAFGPVIPPEQLRAVAAFVVAVRERKLPHPADLYELRSKDQGGYALLPGGSAEKGKQLVQQRCASCHGADGTTQPMDHGEESLGTFARKKAFEVWGKLLNGHPFSSMGPQLVGEGPQRTQELKDILAALCDRTSFPRGTAQKEDVPANDGRCGPALR
jgi:mono/diheme cytochrome c family protein